jgi:hypothetical protein
MGALGRRAGLILALTIFSAWLLAIAGEAIAGPPAHGPLPALDIEGLNRACGAAVDTEGDVYAASPGESKVKVYNPSHALLISIPEPHEPCSLAVDTEGRLYVSEKGTGNVVRYAPDAYPLTPTPIYSGPEAFDESGSAKGIAVDPVDDRLYVAEGSRVSVFQPDGTQGQDEIRQLLVQSTVTSGTYKLTFESQTTAAIPYNAPANNPGGAVDSVQEYLEALSTIGAGNVAVEEGELGERSYFVAFTHALGSQKPGSIGVDSSGLTGGTASFSGFGQVQGYAFSGHIGEGELSNATAVAPFTYATKRYLFVADSAADEVKTLSGPSVKELKVTGSIDGTEVPDSGACPNCSEGFGFGGKDTAIAANWADGHLFVFDASHAVFDEFELSGRYLDQIVPAGLEDAEPSGLAVMPERSAAQEVRIIGTGSFKLGYEGTKSVPIAATASAATVQSALEALPGIGASNVSVRKTSNGGATYVIAFVGALSSRGVAPIVVDTSGLSGSIVASTVRLRGAGPGRVYLGSGAGPGAKLLAFTGLATPSRASLGEPLSHLLANAQAVATDSHGDVYVAADSFIHVFAPDGTELLRPQGGEMVPLIEDPNTLQGLAVDSTGHVYVLENAKRVTYYTPNAAYPPTAGTTYARHEPAVASSTDFPIASSSLRGIAVDPGAGPGHDRLFLSSNGLIRIYAPASDGSGLLNPGFGQTVFPGGGNVSIAVDGHSGVVYVAENPGSVFALSSNGEAILAKINGSGAPGGSFTANPFVTVDQSNGHLLTFQPTDEAAREYDAAGSFVTEFGHFTNLAKAYGIAVDSACSTHEPPLTGAACEAFDPANGNVYVAFDDTSPVHPPYDLTAFGPLAYGEPPTAVTGAASGVGGGSATLHGTLNPNGFKTTECLFEYIEKAEYDKNVEEAKPPFTGATGQACAESSAELGAGTAALPVHAATSGLDPNERYEFRLVASNAYGESQGLAFLFGPPLAKTESANPILYSEATMRAKVDPSGLATTYSFQYGPAAGEYDHSTASHTLASDAGPTEVQATITGLTEGTDYHFRIVAENEAKAVTGLDQTLATLKRRGPESCPNSEYRTGPSARLPDCRAYELVTPAETNGLSPIAASPVDAAVGFNNWLTPPSGFGAGQSITYFTNGTLPSFEGNGVLDGYNAKRAAGEHPAAGWQGQLFSPTYNQADPGIQKVPSPQGMSPDQAYSFWKVDPEESFAELASGIYLRTPSGFEVLGRGDVGEDLHAASQYLSAGGAHVIFSSKVRMEDEPGNEAPPAGTEAIYDRAAGSSHAELLSAAPGGGPFSAGENATYLSANEAGTAVAFSVGGALYLHRADSTTEIATGPNTFAGLSEDGRRVFYAATNAGGSAAPLYVCDTEAGPCAGPGSHAATQIAAGAIFANVSGDGSHAFFSSTVAIPSTGENENEEVAETGAHNLYGWDAATEATRFIARLSPADFENEGFAGIPGMNLAAWTVAVNPGAGSGRAYAPTRSTSDGGILVFQSHARLGAYDNEGEGEIYRYDPSSEEGERLTCQSCDPSGAPASADALLDDNRPPVTARTLIPNLTEDGAEVFFASADRLLPEDANSAADVYEWRAKGTGSPACQRVGGCLALISSGQGEGDSFLYSMSADGHDVFFATLEQLVGTDVIGSKSIYDAREAGGIPEAREAPICTGDACQGEGATPPTLAAPASTGSEDGNFVEEPKARCAKGRHRVKGRCVKPHSKRGQHKHRRANHHSRRASS